MNPVARLFGSLANALLDLGLPTIRQWLRDRIGPAADVAQVTTDGSLVHLDGVKVPIGRSGLLVLERATVTVTALGRAGLPEVRLHGFTGVLAFGGGEHWLRAEVEFVSSPEPDESAWIAGDVAIRNAMWSARAGSPEIRPMSGHARLFVSSSEWRIEGGRLDGEIFRGRFAGTGTFDVGTAEAPGVDLPILPRALSTAAFALEHARVGPVVDAASGVGGKEIALPPIVPVDAELDGELSWSLADGARVELRVASEAIRATLRGGAGATGGALSGRVDAHVRPALLLRGIGLPAEALPREDDVLGVALEIGGALSGPEVKGTVSGKELGFRLGRPRFVPAVLLRDVACELFLKDDRVVVRSTAYARSAKATLDLDAHVRNPSSVRGALRADAVESTFLRDVVRTLGLQLTVPDHVRAAVDFTFAPPGGAPVGEPRISGALTVSTPHSELALVVAHDGAMRIAGTVTAADIVATGLFTGAVSPVDGDVVVAFDLVRHAPRTTLRGTVTSQRLVLAVARRPDAVTYVLEGVSGEVEIDDHALAYERLRFAAHGGRFCARGRIPFSPEPTPSSVTLDLELEEGGAALAEALAQLAAASRRKIHEATSRERHYRIAGEGPRPSDELWIPGDLVGHGRLRWFGDRSLVADVTVETTRTTSLDVRVHVSRGVRLDGSTCTGTLALADGALAGLFGAIAPEDIDEGDVVEVDALVRSDDAGDRLLCLISSDRLKVPLREAPIVVTHLSGELRIDGEGAAWSHVLAEVNGGRISSRGILTRASDVHARVSFSQVEVHDLPAISGREPKRFVHGRLSGSAIARVHGGELHAAGDLMLEDAAFPALDLVRPALARYGLRPPNEDAVGPVTATLVGTGWGLSLRDLKVDLRGATVRGEAGLSRGGELDGHIEVTLEDEYLRTSKALTLPRVLSERLVLPVRIGGPLEQPRVHAGIAELLGRFLKDNRVTTFVSSAVEEARHLLGRPPSPHVTQVTPRHDRIPHEQELDAILRRTLEAYEADWKTLAQRRAEREARRRVG